jgi:hypothetical protein
MHPRVSSISCALKKKTHPGALASRGVTGLIAAKIGIKYPENNIMC